MLGPVLGNTVIKIVSRGANFCFEKTADSHFMPLAKKWRERRVNRSSRAVRTPGIWSELVRHQKPSVAKLQNDTKKPQRSDENTCYE